MPPKPPPPRALLRTEPAPATRAAMLVTLAQTLPGGGKLTVSYVPDRDILTSGALARYAQTVPPREVNTQEPLESLAAAIAEDFADQVVPRWHRVAVHDRDHTVTVEDRQPGWDHPTLLNSLPRPLKSATR